MPANVQLFTNSQPLTLNANVGGRGLKPTSFRQHELSYDGDRLVHSISMTFNDGRVGNFVLLPKHKNSLQIAEAVAGVIASWGLSVAAGKLMKIHPKLRAQPEEVHSLGKYLASMGGDLFIPNLFGYLAIKDSGYYEVITKELVITEPVWVPSGR